MADLTTADVYTKIDVDNLEVTKKEIITKTELLRRKSIYENCLADVNTKLKLLSTETENETKM